MELSDGPLETLMKMFQSQTLDMVPVQERVRQMRNTLVPEIRDSVLHMQATNLPTDFQWTLVYGVLCTGYVRADFEQDVQAVARRYKVPDSHLLRFAITGSDLIPDEDAAYRDMVKIIRKLNNTNCTDDADADDDALNAAATALQPTVAVDPVRKLRIYEVGIKETGLMTKVFKFMLKHWNSEVKSVQFFHRGGKKYFVDFWKDACLKKLCTEVQYVDLQDYTVFGTLE